MYKLNILVMKGENQYAVHYELKHNDPPEN